MVHIGLEQLPLGGQIHRAPDDGWTIMNILDKESRNPNTKNLQSSVNKYLLMIAIPYTLSSYICLLRHGIYVDVY